MLARRAKKRTSPAALVPKCLLLPAAARPARGLLGHPARNDLEMSRSRHPRASVGVRRELLHRHEKTRPWKPALSATTPELRLSSADDARALSSPIEVLEAAYGVDDRCLPAIHRSRSWASAEKCTWKNSGARSKRPHYFRPRGVFRVCFLKRSTLRNISTPVKSLEL